jgi:TonB-linked SusC/RagA family outer membrane protein
MKKTHLVFLLLFFLSLGSYAQQRRTISGSVVASDGSGPLPGATVKVKSTSNGTITDADGKFTLTVAASQTLEVSFVGYETQFIPVPKTNTLKVELKELSRQMDEVVVVGYGVQKKSLVTGAIASVKGSDLEQTGIMRADDALQGKTAGVQIISNSGQPGSSMSIRIRGVGTNGSAQPIYIVDGMPVGDIEYLSPYDIESMEVLKDAASSAIYGARGGNGVVLITTKKGKAGKGTIQYNFNYGIQNIQHKIDVLDAKEYCIIQNESRVNGGQSPLFTQDQINSFNRGTDWQEALLYRNAPTTQHQVSLTGGDALSTYSTSLSYLNQNGILAKGKSQFERYTLSLNADRKFLNEKLLVGENIAVTYVNRQSVTQNSLTAGPLVSALNMDPLTPVFDPYNPDPLYGGYGTSKYVAQEIVNPVARIHFSYGSSYYTKIAGSAYAELKFLNDFRFRSSMGTELTWDGSTGYTPLYKLNASTGNTTANGASQAMDQYTTLNFENILNWSHIYGAHNVSGMIGTSHLKRTSTFISGSRNNLIIDSPDYAYLSMATAINPGVSGGVNNPSALQSYFVRGNYSFNNLYLLTATLRCDGSSRFGPNNRYGWFPSVSIGWNMANEAFMAPYQKWLNSFKPRISWGQNGNENIGDFNFLSTISTYGLGYVFGSQLSTSPIGTGAAPVKVPNPNLKWETGEQFNAGFDMVLMNTVSVNFDYYIKTTKNLLLTSPVPLFLGNAFPTMNAGTVRNWGLELNMGYKKDFHGISFNINGNVAYNINKVTQVGTATGFVSGATLQGISGAVTRMEAGYPMAYFWGFKTKGIFQNWAEVNDYVYTDPATHARKLIQPNAQPGDFRFQDTNNDGQIDDNDRVNLGNPYPKFIFGVNLSVAYKGFDLTVNTSGTAGAKIFSVLRRVDLPMSNYPAWVINRWHGEGTSNSIPRVTTNDLNQSWSRPSDFYVKPGDYWRIRNLAAGYTFIMPKGLYVSKIRVYASVNNLFTFTKYQGYDPEVGGGVLSTGVDAGVYPHARVASIGANVTF